MQRDTGRQLAHWRCHPHLDRMTDSSETWHRVGAGDALRAAAPVAVTAGGHQVAIFLYDGRLRAISNRCNHKGGPLAEGRLHGEFVMCPWHAWEYSVITGRGPAGYDEEQVPVFALSRERPDGVYIRTPPAMPRHLIAHKDIAPARGTPGDGGGASSRARIVHHRDG